MTEIAIVLFIAVTLAIGIRTYEKNPGQATNYHVAGNTMPAWVIGITLVRSSLRCQRVGWKCFVELVKSTF